MDTLAMIAFPSIVLTLGIFGGILTSKNITTWHQKLIKPSFNPPNWIFAPVWTVLYIMIGISGYLIWAEEKGFSSEHTFAWIVYFTQLALNYAWTPLFFGMHWLFISLIEIVFLAISILVNIIVFYNIVPMAGIMLIPYLLWGSFATCLTYKIWQLNKDNDNAELQKNLD